MAVGVKVVNRPGSLSQQMFLPAIAEGLGVTFRHFVKNFFGNVVGLRAKTDIATIEYPEQKKAYPERFRGLHRLMLRDDGQVRCVACMMCPTVCPAHCITIVAEEAPDGSIEKRPKISKSTSSAASCAGCAPRRARATRSAWTPPSTPTRPTGASTGSWTRKSSCRAERPRPRCKVAWADSGAKKSRARRRRRRMATSRRTVRPRVRRRSSI